jgi:hypothetical protein
MMSLGSKPLLPVSEYIVSVVWNPIVAVEKERMHYLTSVLHSKGNI